MEGQPMKHYETSLTDHLRKWLRGFDLPQIAALLFLLGVGVVFIHSTGQQIGTESAAATYLKQLRWIAIGGVGFLFFAHFDYRKLLVPSFFLYLFSLILISAILILKWVFITVLPPLKLFSISMLSVAVRIL